ncbi:MAG TPA: DUF6174 domain-containing protein, partial [Candidatus Limnocylindrales bacterium]|nr:DUF6174 domain-containing protein [Candidatus Limnocylindrales bacterium]
LAGSGPGAVQPGQPSPAGPVVPSGRIGPADLAAARAAWEARGIDDYTWEVVFGCECLLNGSTVVRVADGVPVEAANNGAPIAIADIEGFPLTVEAVFDEARATLEGGGSVSASWDATGLPREMALDRVPEAVDDELGITVRSFTPAE